MTKELISEMTYTDERKITILTHDEYKGYTYYVVSYGTHPCAYIELTENNTLYGKDDSEIQLDCHGGITYANDNIKHITPISENRWIIGWDYAHNGDYFLASNTGKKWTTTEIIQECKEVIKQVMKYEKTQK